MAFAPTVKGGLLARQIEPNDYVLVAAGQTAAVIGTVSGAAKGNFLARLIITPAAVGAGTISLIDGTGGSAVTIPIFDTGTLADLSPFTIELGIVSQVGAWHITTGATVSVIAIGVFT